MTLMLPQCHVGFPRVLTPKFKDCRLPSFDENYQDDHDDDDLDMNLHVSILSQTLSSWDDDKDGNVRKVAKKQDETRDKPREPACDLELLKSASAAMMWCNSYYCDEGSKSGDPSMVEARSSMSSPGRTSMREKLQRRLLKSQREGKSLRYDIAMALSHPPPPPPPPKQPKLTSNISSNWDILYGYHSLHMEEEENRDWDTTSVATRSRDTDESLSRTTRTKRIKRIRPTFSEPESRHASLIRLSRQARYGRRGELPQPKTNIVKLHIYNLIATETIVQLMWGCQFPIGQCFNAVNSGLHALGTGAYHCGVEINGIEYAYGATSLEGTTGVFTCVPKHSPGYEYRTTLDFGSRQLIKRSWVDMPQANTGRSVYREVEKVVNGREVMEQMANEYLGTDYDLLRKNCCTFARDACLRLGVAEEEIPTWFINLADAGAATQDVAKMTFMPISNMLSGAEDDNDSILSTTECETGFEVIAQRKRGSKHKTEMEVVKVVEAFDSIGVRRTLSWTY